MHCVILLSSCVLYLYMVLTLDLMFFFILERDLFGAEPFDPFSCGAGEFPPDIQSKLDEMQVTTSHLNKCFQEHVGVHLVKMKTDII